MNILQINTCDILGGAAKVAYDLHTTLRKAGHNSKMLVGSKYSEDPDIIAIYPNNKGYLQKLYSLMLFSVNMAEMVCGLQYFFWTSARHLLEMDVVRNADIIHLHNTHGGYLNLWIIEKLSQEKPVIWTLHDMWSITGHCAHSFDCDRWKVGCGKCPALKTYPPILIDTSHLLWKIKSKVYKRSDFVITVPAKWLKDKLLESTLSQFSIHLIHNAVDTEIFQPKDKQAVRSALGLPQDRFILIFIADFGSKNPWKGFDYLVDTLRIIWKLYKYNPYIVLIGDSRSFSIGKMGFEGRCVGMIKDPYLSADYYSASDCYILPSIAENSPLVVLEAMSCGTPVVAFDVGGVSESVIHKETGYIARYKDSSDLAGGIKWLMDLGKDKYNEMSHRCVTAIRERHTLKQQAQNFLKLYEALKKRESL